MSKARRKFTDISSYQITGYCFDEINMYHFYFFHTVSPDKKIVSCDIMLNIPRELYTFTDVNTFFDRYLACDRSFGHIKWDSKQKAYTYRDNIVYFDNAYFLPTGTLLVDM